MRGGYRPNRQPYGRQEEITDEMMTMARILFSPAFPILTMKVVYHKVSSAVNWSGRVNLFLV
jgi:hypothetical protein